MHSVKTVAAACLALAALAGPAQAGTVTFFGNTLSGPTFNRPIENRIILSDEGTAVRYSTYRFTVDLAGTYSFAASASYDNFSLLYTAFDPASPLSQALIANDDAATSNTTLFSFGLTAGQAYTYVNTGFSNGDAGAFTATVSGPGNIAAVAAIPEPSTYALALVGLVAVAAAGARKRSRKG